MRTLIALTLTLITVPLAADPYCADELHDPYNVVCRTTRNGASAAAAASATARELGVSRPSAAAIVAAMRAQLEGDYGEPLSPRVYATNHRLLANALQRETNQVPILAAMAQLLDSMPDAESQYRELLPLIDSQPDPGIAAVEVASAIDDDQSAVIILAAAYSRDPEDADVIDAIGARFYDHYIRSAFGPIALTNRGAELRERRRPISTETLMQRASLQLASLAALGLSGEVVDALAVLPGAIPYGEARLDVAAAAILARRPELAAPMLAGLEPSSGTHRLLAAALCEQPEDMFDLIIAMYSNAFGNGGGARAQLFASMLEEHGYVALAAEMRSELERNRISEDVPPEFEARVADIRQRVGIIALPESARADNARLASPRIVATTEKRLPKSFGRGDVTVIDCSDAEKVAASTNLPRFVHPIRMEQSGNDVVAVAISSALDPAGEVALGGYWVLRSRDAGQTWSEYYTGLRQNMPYVVTPASKLPLLDGDRLRIEVEVQELDTSSITFPPMALRLARTKKDLYLEVAWADLTRDSDGDGLTDLYEERIVTDPHDADTDGDAMPDGEDSLPQVAFGGTATIEAEVLAAALDGFALGGGRIVVGAGGENEFACAIRSSSVGERVLFVVGDRAAFAPLMMPGRVVVLTQEELFAYTEKFGPIYPAAIQHFVIEHGGRRAIVELNQSWAGVTLLLTRTSNGWTAVAISSWIT